MKFLVRNLIEKFGGQFIFRGKAPGEGEVVLPPAPPSCETHEDPKEREREIQYQAQLKRDDERKKLNEQIDKTGEISDFGEGFVKHPDFITVGGILIEMTGQQGSESLFNFNNWLVIASGSDAKELENIFTITWFPGGIKGKDAFVKALAEKPDEDDKSAGAAAKRETWNKAYRELQKIVEALRKLAEQKTDAVADLRSQTGKAGPIPDTIHTGVKNLMRNIKRGSGMEKALTIGAVAAVASIIWKYWDSDMIRGIKWSQAATFAGALWGINYLSGKVSSDGKTIVQRFDVALDIENMKDDAFKGYAFRYEMDKDQEKHRTFVLLESKSIQTLFDLYKEASQPGGNNEIDPRKLGFYKGEINGKAAFQIMKELVELTSLNVLLEQERRIAIEKGEEPPKSIDQLKAAKANAGLIQKWTNPSYASAQFEKKYINPVEAETATQRKAIEVADYRFSDVVFKEYKEANKYNNNELMQEDIKIGRARKITAKAAEMSSDAMRTVKDYGILAGRYMWGKTKQGWQLTKDYVLCPVWDEVKAKYERWIDPTLGKTVKDALAWGQQQDLEKVFPPEMGIDVTSRNTATVMGFPGIKFDVTSEGGTEKVKIEDTELLIKDGVSGNKAKTDKIKDSITSRVLELIEPEVRTVARLQNKTPKWDSKEKKWYFENVKVAGHRGLGLPKKNDEKVYFIIDNAKKAHFYVTAKDKTTKELRYLEIDDFDKIDTKYRDAQIRKQIWDYKHAGWAKPYLHGIPVEIFSVTNDAIYGAVIDGKIGGLKFQAVPGLNTATQPAINSGIEFYDGTTAGGLDLLEIKKDNGGQDLIDALSAQILENDNDFNEPFARLEHKIANAGDSLTSRISHLQGKWKFWQQNWDKVINGKVLQKQWSYTLQFKRWETLQMFGANLHGKKVSEIDTVYKDIIVQAAAELQTIEQYILTLEAQGGPEKIGEKFDQLLSGQAAGGVPKGLEFVNYRNDEYKKYFMTFKAQITQEKYDYPGIDMTDTFRSYKPYLTLLQVWSVNTRSLGANKPPNQPLTQPEKDGLDNVMRKIIAHMEAAQAKGGMGHLPKAETEDDMKKWML